MRTFALLFALISVAGAVFHAYSLLEDARQKVTQKEVPLDVQEERKIGIGMVAAAGLGVLGGLLLLRRKGKFAAVILLAGFLAPLGVLASFPGIQASDTRIPPVLMFTVGLLIAAVCALFVKPVALRKKGKGNTGIPKDFDMVG